jgi:hypothetical protein
MMQNTLSKKQKESQFWLRIGMHVLFSILILTYSLFTYRQEEATIFKEILNFVAGMIVTTIAGGLNYFAIAFILHILEVVGIKNKGFDILDLYNNSSELSMFVWCLLFAANGVITYKLWGPVMFGVI